MNRTVGKVKYYAIKQGFDFSKNEVVHGLILSSWDEAKRLVMGVSERVHGVQPEYKSFSTMEDAEAYLDSDQSYLIKKTKTIREMEFIVMLMEVIEIHYRIIPTVLSSWKMGN